MLCQRGKGYVQKKDTSGPGGNERNRFYHYFRTGLVCGPDAGHRGRRISERLSSVSGGRASSCVHRVQGVRRALFYRRQGREIREFGNAARGRIVNVIMKSAPYEDSHHRTRYRRYYVLEAEVPDPVTGVVNRIESPAYSRPIHRYLASPEVTVYTDRTGWKHYMDDFQWKERKSDPGIFEENRVFDEYGRGAVFGKALVILIMLLMLYNIIFH